ncbi:MAG: glycosyltransferase family 2 protein [Verrucomicrobiae bacterium]|nr:glycosyltransferase family 2 protein [Verrucomicrobiae bacterium]
MSVVFWLCLLLVGYTYAGYPLLLRAWLTMVGRRGGVAESGGASPPERVSVMIVAHNEAGRIAARIENLRQCERPWETEVIVVCDGCSDDTAALAREASDPTTLPVRVVEQEGRQGKASGLNRGVAEVRGGIIVFADARQRFHRLALTRLIAPFSDPVVAAVSGNLDIAPSGEGTGAGIDAYWKLERYIRRLESDLDSVIGCTGAIYAIRRDAFEPLPADTILDDVVIPMRALVAGRRVLFESDATAFDPQELAPEQEKRRKIRTLAGNYQMLFRYPQWLLPWRNRAWWQLISHKYLRLAGPFLLAGCLLSSAWLSRGNAFYGFALAGQIVCYALALAGLAFRGLRSPLVTAPAGFVFLQWQGLRALFHYLRLRRSTQSGAWS